MESRRLFFDIVGRLSDLPQVNMIRCGIWKPRTHPGGFEGLGEEALRWVDEARQHYPTLRFCCEVANPTHVEAALRHGIDAVWIGARTTGNPFSMGELAESLRGCRLPVLVKNAPAPDVEPWMGAIERLLSVGIGEIMAVHRGFSTYNAGDLRNDPLWQIPIELHRRMPDMPLLCDPSHIAGHRDKVAQIAQMALDMGFDGLMVECHPSPEDALTDASQQLTPDALAAMLSHLSLRQDDADKAERLLHNLRSRIDEVDHQLLALLQERMQISREIAQTKSENNISIVQNSRWDYVLNSRMMAARKMGINEGFVKEVFEKIHAESVRVQVEGD